jgi:hypothetical protein
MAQATMTLLLRAGVLDEDAIMALAEEYERRASWERDPTAKEAMEQTAHGLRLAPFGLEEAPLVDPASEHRAQYEREQMRKRTAMIEAWDSAPD